jgi:hypothetical protein
VALRRHLKTPVVGGENLEDRGWDSSNTYMTAFSMWSGNCWLPLQTDAAAKHHVGATRMYA